jgi:hypothetical protein
MTSQNNTWQNRVETELRVDCDWADFNKGGNKVSPLIDRVKSVFQSELERALQECLPEEKTFTVDDGMEIPDDKFISLSGARGWNSSREQFIKNARERGIELK